MNITIHAHTDYYTDYLKRSKVSKVSLERNKLSEVIGFLNAQKGSATKSIAATGEFPLMGSILRLTSKTSGKYLASVVSNSKEFYFEATMSKEDIVLAGKTVRLTYSPKSKTWRCSDSKLIARVGVRWRSLQPTQSLPNRRSWSSLALTPTYNGA